jgi:NADH:ubiquinone oxidoreductase subunit 5 (subunit L)/multisubunit Na+/H+ antiporter MnhA subunit
MEGPTPVSALLHAATMVTAGVFLLIRCSALFEYSIFYLNCIAVIGALTALFCSMIAVFQYDIKKIIAYSTCSQLGYMFFSCGISNYQIAMFHLFNHAFFKALLFLGAGCIISALMDEQDIRKMGALAKQIPLTYISILIGSLAITGFPFLAGFYSKDVVLEIAYTRFLIDGYFIYLMGVLAAFFTALYSIRLLVFVFFMFNNSFKINKLIQESNVLMLIPLYVLSLMTLIVGYVFSDLFLG